MLKGHRFPAGGCYVMSKCRDRTIGEIALSQPQEESVSPPGASPLEVAETADHAANHAMRWWILAVLGVAQLMVILDNTVVNIALPTAQHALGFSNADRQWVVTAYALAFGSGPAGNAGEPAGGRAAQLHHRVRVLRADLRRGRGSRRTGAPQGQHADPVGTAPGRRRRGTSALESGV
jgi:hypothetical protein